ncbi:MAG: two-component system response regulator [Methylophaga sp.]|nr:MAG: two-component system response regulator [Methylophaga sp.]
MDGKHILIVDDVAENIQVAMNILQEDNYDFSFANSGEKAISILRENPTAFDLILLDIMMPNMDGYEVCEYLRASPQWQDIPVIFLTARTDAESISRGFEVGGVDYILKPFHAAELLARVRSHVQLYHAKKILKQQNIDLEIKAHHTQQRLLSELEDNQKEMIYVLTELMEATSDETGKHIRRVAELSSLLARHHPSLSEEDANILFHASPMHDIGKMTIPHDILYKPGRYTEQEFELMKSHTTNAYNLLRHSDRKFTKAAATIAHEHHEKWNGKGYPRGLKGEEIHIYGRIVALADVFDALTHARCYKEAWKMDDVSAYIEDHRGTQFDPDLVDIYFNHQDEFEAISKIS